MCADAAQINFLIAVLAGQLKHCTRKRLAVLAELSDADRIDRIINAQCVGVVFAVGLHRDRNCLLFVRICIRHDRCIIGYLNLHRGNRLIQCRRFELLKEIFAVRQTLECKVRIRDSPCERSVVVAENRCAGLAVQIGSHSCQRCIVALICKSELCAGNLLAVSDSRISILGDRAELIAVILLGEDQLALHSFLLVCNGQCCCARRSVDIQHIVIRAVELNDICYAGIAESDGLTDRNLAAAGLDVLPLSSLLGTGCDLDFIIRSRRSRVADYVFQLALRLCLIHMEDHEGIILRICICRIDSLRDFLCGAVLKEDLECNVVRISGLILDLDINLRDVVLFIIRAVHLADNALDNRKIAQNREVMLLVLFIGLVVFRNLGLHEIVDARLNVHRLAASLRDEGQLLCSINGLDRLLAVLLPELQRCACNVGIRDGVDLADLQMQLIHSICNGQGSALRRAQINLSPAAAVSLQIEVLVNRKRFRLRAARNLSLEVGALVGSVSVAAQQNIILRKCIAERCDCLSDSVDSCVLVSAEAIVRIEVADLENGERRRGISLIPFKAVSALALFAFLRLLRGCAFVSELSARAEFIGFLDICKVCASELSVRLCGIDLAECHCFTVGEFKFGTELLGDIDDCGSNGAVKHNNVIALGCFDGRNHVGSHIGIRLGNAGYFIRNLAEADTLFCRNNIRLIQIGELVYTVLISLCAVENLCALLCIRLIIIVQRLERCRIPHTAERAPVRGHLSEAESLDLVSAECLTLLCDLRDGAVFFDLNFVLIAVDLIKTVYGNNCLIIIDYIIICSVNRIKGELIELCICPAAVRSDFLSLGDLAVRTDCKCIGLAADGVKILSQCQRRILSRLDYLGEIRVAVQLHGHLVGILNGLCLGVFPCIELDDSVVLRIFGDLDIILGIADHIAGRCAVLFDHVLTGIQRKQIRIGIAGSQRERGVCADAVLADRECTEQCTRKRPAAGFVDILKEIERIRCVAHGPGIIRIEVGFCIQICILCNDAALKASALHVHICIRCNQVTFQERGIHILCIRQVPDQVHACVQIQLTAAELSLIRRDAECILHRGLGGDAVELNRLGILTAA